MNERKLSKGGFEDIFPEVIHKILVSENPDSIAVAAGLTKRQWDCISHYLDDPKIEKIAEELHLNRPNVYYHLSQGFSKLERLRRK